MHPQDGTAARKAEAQLSRQLGQHVEQAGLIQHSSGPADPRRHGRVAFYQFDAPRGRCGGGMRVGLLAG